MSVFAGFRDMAKKCFEVSSTALPPSQQAGALEKFLLMWENVRVPTCVLSVSLAHILLHTHTKFYSIHMRSHYRTNPPTHTHTHNSTNTHSQN